jgi:hypothetical protein
LSTESILSGTRRQAPQTAACSACGAPLAADQRYCLECGQRATPMSSFLRGEQAPGAEPAPPPAQPPGTVLAGAAPAGEAPRANAALTVIAGVGVLLLAMGIGVLIGRSGGSGKPAPTQVVTVAGAPTTGSASTTEAAFSDDWPSGTKGFTVQLQTLAQEGTAISAVQAAKTAATGKGAKDVGALLSDHFSSLTAGSYVIYSGVFHKRADAQKALSTLKKEFPSAKVVSVSSSASGGKGASSGGSGSGGDIEHPAPPSVLNSLHDSKGQSYEEKSKNLPDVISTG